MLRAQPRERLSLGSHAGPSRRGGESRPSSTLARFQGSRLSPLPQKPAETGPLGRERVRCREDGASPASSTPLRHREPLALEPPPQRVGCESRNRGCGPARNRAWDTGLACARTRGL